VSVTRDIIYINSAAETMQLHNGEPINKSYTVKGYTFYQKPINKSYTVKGYTFYQKHFSVQSILHSDSSDDGDYVTRTPLLMHFIL
jgi:hypothetical protein